MCVTLYVHEGDSRPVTPPSNRRKVSRRELKDEPYLVWNAYVDLLAMSEYEELTPRQRVAYLAFWYDSEVQNGGHLQYFENRGVALVDETLDALSALGADNQRQILRQAYDIRHKSPDDPIATAEEFAARSLDGDFDELDHRYYEANPSITDSLKAYLETHQDDFVVIVH